MYFARSFPKTDKYTQLSADWDKVTHEFEESDFRDIGSAEKIVELASELDKYEARFLGNFWSRTLKHPRGAEAARQIRELAITASCRSLEDAEMEKLERSTRLLAIPLNIVSRRTEREGMLNEARQVLPLSFVPA